MSLSLLALLTPPLTVLLAGRRLSDGAPLALVVTVVVTWCVAVALGLLFGGVDDIATILMLVFVVLPMIGAWSPRVWPRGWSMGAVCSSRRGRSRWSAGTPA